MPRRRCVGARRRAALVHGLRSGRGWGEGGRVGRMRRVGTCCGCRGGSTRPAPSPNSRRRLRRGPAAAAPRRSLRWRRQSAGWSGRAGRRARPAGAAVPRAPPHPSASPAHPAACTQAIGLIIRHGAVGMGNFECPPAAQVPRTRGSTPAAGRTGAVQSGWGGAAAGPQHAPHLQHGWLPPGAAVLGAQGAGSALGQGGPRQRVPGRRGAGWRA